MSTDALSFLGLVGDTESFNRLVARAVTAGELRTLKLESAVRRLEVVSRANRETTFPATGGETFTLSSALPTSSSRWPVLRFTPLSPRHLSSYRVMQMPLNHALNCMEGLEAQLLALAQLAEPELLERIRAEREAAERRDAEERTELDHFYTSEAWGAF